MSGKLNSGRRIRRSSSDWQSLMARYEVSGQRQASFCAEQGVGLSTFCRWRKLLSTKGSPASAGRNAAVFVELAPEPDKPVENPPWDVELELGRGVILRLRQAPC